MEFCQKKAKNQSENDTNYFPSAFSKSLLTISSFKAMLNFLPVYFRFSLIYISISERWEVIWSSVDWLRLSSRQSWGRLVIRIRVLGCDRIAESMKSITFHRTVWSSHSSRASKIKNTFGKWLQHWKMRAMMSRMSSALPPLELRRRGSRILGDQDCVPKQRSNCRRRLVKILAPIWLVLFW